MGRDARQGAGGLRGRHSLACEATAYAVGPRMFDPGTYRFIGADQFIGSGANQELQLDPLTGNRYLYAGANPANMADDGHSPTKRWVCRCSCAIRGGPRCTGHTYGVGTGSTQAGASKVGKRVCTQQTPAGCNAGHCQCACWSGKTPKLPTWAIRNFPVYWVPIPYSLIRPIVEPCSVPNSSRCPENLIA